MTKDGKSRVAPTIQDRSGNISRFSKPESVSILAPRTPTVGSAWKPKRNVPPLNPMTWEKKGQRINWRR